MAKSTGNNILPYEFFTGKSKHLSKKYSASVVRFFILQAHYRSVLDFSDKALLASEKGYNKLMDAVNTLSAIKASNKTSDFDIMVWIEDCYKAMNDDFNSPILIAELFRIVKFINQINDQQATISPQDLALISKHIKEFVFDILGLKTEISSVTRFEGKLKETVDLLISMRKEARANKDFEMSDKIRDSLKEIGIQLKDGKDGTIFTIEN
jgi:cysteinyl-tRNA synthetase